MIPDSAGATPYGLADSYLTASNVAAASAGVHSKGPGQLLAYHAAELFLKTFMRSAGQTIAQLRAHGHDLLSMVECACGLGLELNQTIIDQARRMEQMNDYVRARYVVVDVRSDIPVESVLRFTATIRLAVIAALDLDDAGVPKGDHRLGALPIDYPVQR